MTKTLYITEYASNAIYSQLLSIVKEVQTTNTIDIYSVYDKPYGKKKPAKQDVVSHRDDLLNVIKTNNITRVISLGEIPSWLVLGTKSRALKSLRNREYTAQGIKFYFSYSILSILQDPNYRKYIVEDIKWAIHKNLNLSQLGDTEYDYKYLEDGDIYNYISRKEHSMDFETTGLDFNKENVIVASYSSAHGKAVLTPEPVEIDPDATIVGHNLPFDKKFYMKATKDERRHRLWDTMTAGSLLDENIPDNSLKHYASVYSELGHYDDEVNIKDIKNGDIETTRRYAAKDGDFSYRLKHIFEPKLRQEGLLPLFEHLMEVQNVLIDMEYRGVKIDCVVREILRDKYAMEIQYCQKLMEDISIKYGYGPDVRTTVFNPNAHGHKLDMLYQKLGLPVLKKTPGGLASTDQTALKLLSGLSNITEEAKTFVNNLLEYNIYQKLLSTYFYNTNLHNDRIHTTYSLSRGAGGGTRTGRLSSANPNLQNIPRKYGIKRMFIPDEGKIWFEADYSQLELRVVAYLAQEQSMIDAFNNGYDIHTATFADSIKAAYSDVEAILQDKRHALYQQYKEGRTAQKTQNFMILYGGGPNKLLTLLRNQGIVWDYDQAKKFISQWFVQNPSIDIYLKKVKHEAEKDGTITTPVGRIRHLPSLNGLDNQLKQRILRQAGNYPVQSLASDIALMGLKMVDSYSLLTPLLTVHDSVCGQTHILEADCIDMVTKAMEDKTVAYLKDRFKVDFNVPLKVNVKVGKAWEE